MVGPSRHAPGFPNDGFMGFVNWEGLKPLPQPRPNRRRLGVPNLSEPSPGSGGGSCCTGERTPLYLLNAFPGPPRGVVFG